MEIRDGKIVITGQGQADDECIRVVYVLEIDLAQAQRLVAMTKYASAVALSSPFPDTAIRVPSLYLACTCYNGDVDDFEAIENNEVYVEDVEATITPNVIYPSTTLSYSGDTLWFTDISRKDLEDAITELAKEA